MKLRKLIRVYKIFYKLICRKLLSYFNKAFSGRLICLANGRDRPGLPATLKSKLKT
jgi:hypothetical protein